MGRFSSVQTYTDTASDKRTVPYEQARGSGSNDKQTIKSVQPEKVVNPYGSTAGAGSGEFHIYRQARAREMQRQAHLQQTAEEQEEARAFALKVQQEEEECAARTAKRRAKRQKQKNSKARKRNLEQAGIVLEAPVITTTSVDEEEFVYVPEQDQLKETNGNEKDVPVNTETSFPNDGSLLEKVKATLEEATTEESLSWICIVVAVLYRKANKQQQIVDFIALYI